jgi:hypothetical protein
VPVAGDAHRGGIGIEVTRILGGFQPAHHYRQAILSSGMVDSTRRDGAACGDDR